MPCSSRDSHIDGCRRRRSRRNPGGERHHRADRSVRPVVVVQVDQIRSAIAVDIANRHRIFLPGEIEQDLTTIESGGVRAVYEHGLPAAGKDRGPVVFQRGTTERLLAASYEIWKVVAGDTRQHPRAAVVADGPLRAGPGAE